MLDLTLSHRKFGPTSQPRRGLLAYLSHINAVYQQRKALSALGDERLKDLGLTREDVAHEVSRPLWDAPGHWYSRPR